MNFGLAATTFKEPFGNKKKKKDFNHRQQTKILSCQKNIWSSKDAETKCNIKWSIVKKLQGKQKLIAVLCV